MKTKEFFRSTFTFILKLPVFLIKLPIYLYKWLVSPLLPHACRFYPTCSNYCLSAIDEFGIKGLAIGFHRILRCMPKSKTSGYDPIPTNIKGDAKWLF